ncbi:SGNH/GDSL hydrolase family protein [Nocardiopsis sp. HNM0947]|uniref:SGNH/GDSL hydrolase family protein n=1 Tax=Nocardiopsis coralli TaxID=2772213 RepID=A0ABR9P1X3_9ACTN|nr:SGNH/GDSL hydrolase family protein [Nocardiopsis coralli]MBE2997824.1 SGNH/GDSL hydrolase family protein [Nocardiopsis coralli]
MFRTDDTPVHTPVPTPGRLRRWAARAALPAVALLGLSLAGSPVAAETAEAAEEIPEAAAFEEYVAIGDSFTAGPLVVQQKAPLLGCMQSDANYPKMLAEQLGITELVDVSCSGAVVEDLYEAQFDDQPPQLDALTADTDLVTIGIGGNDFGFADVMIECATRSITSPNGSPCADHYGDELDERIEELRGDIAGVFEDVAERSPDATVMFVGYLQILPESDGCWPTVPISSGDVPYLDQAQIDLNAMLEEESAAHGATFVDVFERGYDSCQPSDVRWVEGVIPENAAAPVHPNRAGMEATTAFVSDALGVPVP